MRIAARILIPLLLISPGAFAYGCSPAKTVSEAVQGPQPFVFKARVIRVLPIEHAGIDYLPVQVSTLASYKGEPPREFTLYIEYGYRPSVINEGDLFLFSSYPWRIQRKDGPREDRMGANMCSLRKRISKDG
jgi:hypothetical protein